MKILGKDYRAHYDVIVIGGGIGGLFCANFLADAGMRVLLIEQHYVLGGYCSSFRRKGFLFDSATHFYPLLGNPKTLTGKILKDLGIETEWIKLDPVDKFHFPDNTTFTVPADFSAYVQRLKERFPEQEEEIDVFFREAREAYLYGLLYYFKETPNRKAERFREVTLKEKLDELFQDKKLKAHLMADHSHWGSLPGETSFLFDSMLRLAYFLGNYYPKGSSQAFADDLAEGLKDRGGDILVYTQVEEILLKEDRVVGIVAQTRRNKDPQRVTFSCDCLVSNADVRQTYEELLGPENCPQSTLEQIRTLRPSRACYLLHMGLKELPTELKEEVEGYYWFSWDPADLQRTFFKIFFTTLFDPGIAPENHDILIVQKWSSAEFHQVSNWQEEKRRTEEYVMSHLRRLIPGLDEKEKVRLSATALTSQRYTFNYCGSMLGWEMTPDQLGSHRPDNRSHIENLFLVGHWTRPGGGITPVIVSAQRVAELILGEDSRSMESLHDKRTSALH